MENRPPDKTKKTADKPSKALNGLDDDMNLRSVTFATTENLYLNQHDDDES